MAKRRSGDPIKAAARTTRAKRRVGEGAVCSCAEDRPVALIAGRQPPICYECDAKARGKPGMEWHHPAGKANNPAVMQVPANDHRELSADQYDWPQGVLQNRDGDPLIAMAGNIRGLVSMLHWLIDMLVGRIPSALESFATEQRQRLGPGWWKGTALDGFLSKDTE